jgi:hypothetical protein
MLIALQMSHSTALNCSAWSWALLEKLPIVQLFKNFPTFYGPWRFNTVFTTALLWSPSWPKSIQSVSPYPMALRYILVISSHLCLSLLSGLFHSGLPINTPYAFLFSPSVLRAPRTSSFLTWSFYLYLAKSTSYEAPHYAVFSNNLSLYPTSVQIFSSALCPKTPSVYFPPLRSETNFHIYRKRQAKL